MKATGLEGLQCLAGESTTDEFVAEALPWVHEAGNPYFDWFFGGHSEARVRIDEWMRRPSSELFIGRAWLLRREERTVGGFIALPGAALHQCRIEDAAAAIRAEGPQGRGDLLNRMRASHRLFPPVEPDDFYGSKLWLLPELRGRGYGVRVVRAIIALAQELGFPRCRLDVWAGNREALKVYEFLGLRKHSESTLPEAGFTYIGMVRDTGTSAS